MKKNKIKNISKEQAIKDVDKLKKDLFNFRFQKNKWSNKELFKD